MKAVLCNLSSALCPLHSVYHKFLIKVQGQLGHKQWSPIDYTGRAIYLWVSLMCILTDRSCRGKETARKWRLPSKLHPSHHSAQERWLSCLWKGLSLNECDVWNVQICFLVHKLYKQPQKQVWQTSDHTKRKYLAFQDDVELFSPATEVFQAVLCNIITKATQIKGKCVFIAKFTPVTPLPSRQFCMIKPSGWNMLERWCWGQDHVLRLVGWL